MDARTDKKWAEVLQYAWEHAICEGPHKDYKYLQNAFVACFNDHEERAEKGTTWSFGGVAFSNHNCIVFSNMISRALLFNESGYKGPRLNDEQLKRLKGSLYSIVSQYMRRS